MTVTHPADHQLPLEMAVWPHGDAHAFAPPPYPASSLYGYPMPDSRFSPYSLPVRPLSRRPSATTESFSYPYVPIVASPEHLPTVPTFVPNLDTAAEWQEITTAEAAALAMASSGASGSDQTLESSSSPVRQGFDDNRDITDDSWTQPPPAQPENTRPSSGVDASSSSEAGISQPVSPTEATSTLFRSKALQSSKSVCSPGAGPVTSRYDSRAALQKGMEEQNCIPPVLIRAIEEQREPTSDEVRKGLQ